MPHRSFRLPSLHRQRSLVKVGSLERGMLNFRFVPVQGAAVAGSHGSVSFSVVQSAATPATPGWQQPILADSGCKQLPGPLAQPAGGQGPVQWSFSGRLKPGGSGSVSWRVSVD